MNLQLDARLIEYANRVKAGEELTVEELRAAFSLMRESRRAAAASSTSKKVSTSKTPTRTAAQLLDLLKKSV
jgi:hypothetical protein